MDLGVAYFQASPFFKSEIMLWERVKFLHNAIQQIWLATVAMTNSWPSLYVPGSIQSDVTVPCSACLGMTVPQCPMRIKGLPPPVVGPKHAEIFDPVLDCIGVSVDDQTPWKSALGSCHPDTFASTMKPCSA